MTNELLVSDVLADEQKNFCNIYLDDNDDTRLPLTDSLYYTETEYVDLINQENYSDLNHLSIISLNIANLLSKLSSLKLFLNNISTINKRPDIIVVVETHISSVTNVGYTPNELANIIQGYNFFYRGRTNKRGGGVGIFVRKDINSDAKECIEIHAKVNYIEEVFEYITVEIPAFIPTQHGNYKRSLMISAVYRPPNNNNFDSFNHEMRKLLFASNKRKNEVIIAGDFNLDLLKYDTHQPTARTSYRTETTPKNSKANKNKEAKCNAY